MGTRWKRAALRMGLVATAVAIAAGCGGGGGGDGGDGDAVKNIHDSKWVAAQVAEQSGREVKACTNVDEYNVVPDTVAWTCDVKSSVSSGYEAYSFLIGADGKILGTE